MTLKYWFYIVTWIWFIAEQVLSFKTRDKSAQAKSLDKYSLQAVMITIFVCMFLAVFLSENKIGDMPYNHDTLRIAGMVLIVAGMIFRWTAILTLRKYFSVYVRIRDDHKVIKNGLYRYIRHPSYTGGLISYFGIGLYFCSWLSVLVMIVPLFLAYLYRIRQEEKTLIQALGNDYIEYAKSTKRLIPGIY